MPFPQLITSALRWCVDSNLSHCKLLESELMVQLGLILRSFILLRSGQHFDVK